MNKILAAILIGSCFCALAESIPDGFWPKGEISSGQVIEFEDFYNGKKNVAVVKLDNINIPQQYAADTRNCRAFLFNDGFAWNLMRVQCDYRDNEEVRIYYIATFDVPPLNIGDEINISATTEVPILGYFKAFVFTKEEVK